ncbi:MAG TPA: SLC13 family permease [Anaerolineae bacterium]|nr:SLC13 family permease [Anaerolineae bacterium]
MATIAAAALLLVTEWLRPDLTALLVVITLSITGVVTPEEALSGFSQAAVITILAVYILSAGLEKTGVTRGIGRFLLRITRGSETMLVAALTMSSAMLSLFMNTIAAAAMMLPATMGIARQARIRPSRLLMPVAFGALLGGAATLLTTANIVTSATLDQAGLQPFGLLDFLPVGLPMAICGIILILILSPHLLPRRDMAGSIARMHRMNVELTQLYHLHEVTSELVIDRGSAMAGQTLRESSWRQDLGVTVLGISHNGRLQLTANGDTEVSEGDILIVKGEPDLERLRDYGIHLNPESELGDELVSQDFPLVEIIIPPRSAWEGETPRELHLRERYGIQVLAIWREGEIVLADVASIPFRIGDAALLQGPSGKFTGLRRDPNVLILTEETEGRPSVRAPLAVGILLASLVLAATGVLPLAIAALAGAALMVITGCISMEDAYAAVEWRTIILVAGMLSLSVALQTSGSAAWLAKGLVSISQPLGTLGTAGILLLVSILFSLFLGGQAGAVIMAPIAIAAGGVVGADPRAMAMAVAIGCSVAFLSPLGHPANLLVLGPGGYRFRDYVRLGAPLTLLSILVTLVTLHWFWGL